MRIIAKHSQIFLNFCRLQKGLNEKTLQAYNLDLRQFTEFCVARNVTSVYGKKSLEAYIGSLMGAYKARSVKRKVATLKAFFRFLEREDLIESNPFHKIYFQLKEPEVLPRTIPQDIVEQLLNYFYDNHGSIMTVYENFRFKRDIAIIELLFFTGVRISEICNLRKLDVDISRQCMLVRAKGNKERSIAIPNFEVCESLKDYIKIRNSLLGSRKAFFFLSSRGGRFSEQSARMMLAERAQAAKIKQLITPHMFRHTMATLLLEEGVDLRIIQRILGHSSIVTTQIYAHVSAQLQRDTIKLRHPRASMRLRAI